MYGIGFYDYVQIVKTGSQKVKMCISGRYLFIWLALMLKLT